MSLSQVLWSLTEHKPLSPGCLDSEQELENLLDQQIDLLDPNWLVIGRQVKTSNGKFLDLLCIDRNENLIVIELKKDLTPREVTAQVIEYASYMAEKEPQEINQIFGDYSAKYLHKQLSLNDAYLKKFGAELDPEQLNTKVKMVIVATKMDDGTEHILRYLRKEYGVDINILFFSIFKHNDDRLLSRVWFEEDLDLDDDASNTPQKWNDEFYVSFGTDNIRSWEDAVQYGFISAGGGAWYTKTLNMLHAGDRIWVNIPHNGYVGVGEVIGDSVLAYDAVLDGQNMRDLKLKGDYFFTSKDSELKEYVVPVKWIKTVPKNQAVRELGFFGNQNTVCRPTTSKWNFTVDRLKKLWNIK